MLRTRNICRSSVSKKRGTTDGAKTTQGLRVGWKVVRHSECNDSRFWVRDVSHEGLAASRSTVSRQKRVN
ncbi:unnamed protein product [Nezara viridula]|uniref:Uncharacterized protein n=1 Tax=Nezara viridula TaxID=85310 RepID=A0A9P0MSA2_NEZVI|nr:unnamed protein product [Nezara viridula]